MSYITKSNARHLEYQVDRSQIEKLSLEDLYKYSLWMLTKKEQQWLAAARAFYENPEFFIDRIYQKVEIVDNGTLVYVGGTPAYHASQDCEVLLRDYHNYVIPAEILDRGDKDKQVLQRFREWWKLKEQLLHSNPRQFLIDMELQWKLRNPPSIRSIEANNSGVERHANRDIAEVEADIDSLIESMKELRSQEPDLIKKYGEKTFLLKKNSFLDMENQDNRELLERWHEMKESLKDNLRIFFQLRFNPDLKLDGSLLSALGFKACTRCHEMGIVSKEATEGVA